MSSGRLVILPKKSYCPWNSKNVERVLRDERVDRERQERELEAQQNAESRHRWETLKRQQGQHQQGQHQQGQEQNVPQRFSLFEKEEQEYCQAKASGKPPPPPSTTKNQQLSVGIMPVFLGESVAKVQASKEAQRVKQSTHLYRQKEEKRKHQLDPMKYFSGEHSSSTTTTMAGNKALANSHVFWQAQQCHGESHETTLSIPIQPQPQQQPLEARTTPKARERKKRRRSDSESSDSDSSSSSSSSSSGSSSSDGDSETGSSRRRHERRKRKSHKKQCHHHKKKKKKKKSRERSSSREIPLAGMDMEELRKRRLEREQKERLREQAVIREATGMTRGQHRYHNQYNPRFSRK